MSSLLLPSLDAARFDRIVRTSSRVSLSAFLSLSAFSKSLTILRRCPLSRRLATFGTATRAVRSTGLDSRAASSCHLAPNGGGQGGASQMLEPVGEGTRVESPVSLPLVCVPSGQPRRGCRPPRQL